MPTAGYSGTPLAKKLGIKPGFVCWFHDAPEHYFDLFEDLPQDLQILGELTNEIDFAHLFLTEKDQLAEVLSKVKPHLKKNGLIWLSWPKGTSKISTNVNREVIREVGLASGLVDVKVAAVDDDWSGLKFVFRTKDR